MSLPDHHGQAAPRVRESARAPHTLRRSLHRALLAGSVIAIGYLTLMPNNGHARFRIVPLPLYRWLAAPEHDYLVNVAAFGFLALIIFLIRSHTDSRHESLVAAIFAHRIARLAALLALVCAIEVVQKWIPGRTSSLEDVCTGWSGIFAAWLVAELRGRPVTTTKSAGGAE